ncbi:hypothetical protein BLSTO_05719 [Blastocystis sp. subtype 1]
MEENGVHWTCPSCPICDCLRWVENVKEVKLIGLNELERVLIGEKSFTKFWHGSDFDPYRRFYLKNCERLKELKMSRFSFSDYSVCEIENVPSLEVMEMGVLERDSFNFYQVPLTLKNLPSLKSLLFGGFAFWNCSHATFENLPELTSIQLGEGALRFFYADKSSELVMRNLPKLTSLINEYGKSFEFPRSVILEVYQLPTSLLPLTSEE